MKRSLRTLSTAARTARATPATCSHLPRPSAFASSRAFSSTPAQALATVSDLELAKDLKITGDEPLHVAPAADMLGFEVSETQPAGGSDVGRPIYLDAQATTPTDPRVLDAMLPYMTNQYGNPHSKTHAYGWETEKAVEQGRQVRFLCYLLQASSARLTPWITVRCRPHRRQRQGRRLHLGRYRVQQYVHQGNCSLQQGEEEAHVGSTALPLSI